MRDHQKIKIHVGAQEPKSARGLIPTTSITEWIFSESLFPPRMKAEARKFEKHDSLFKSFNGKENLQRGSSKDKFFKQNG